MHTKATGYQENASEQTGSDIGITAPRIDTQESQTAILPRPPEIITRSAPEIEFTLCFEDSNYADYRLRHPVQESDQFQRSYIENAFIFCWESERYMLQHTFCITRTLLHVRNASKSNTGLEHLILVYTGLRKTFAYYRKRVHFKYTIVDINYYSNLCQTHKIGKPDN